MKNKSFFDRIADVIIKVLKFIGISISPKNTESKSTMVELVTELEKIPQCEEVDYMIKEAKSGEYHNYKNRKYVCGKQGFCAVAVAFSKRNPAIEKYLKPLACAIANGDYDETCDDIDSKKMSNEIMKDSAMTMKQKKHLHKTLDLKIPKKTQFGKRYF